MREFAHADILPVVQLILKTSHSIAENDRLSDWGLDSVLTVNLFMELEERLEMTFEDEDLVGTNFESISAILAVANRARQACSLPATGT